MTREWLVKVRFWPLSFIVISGIYTVWVTLWYMSIETQSEFLVALPIAGHALTGTLINRFMDTKAVEV